MSEAPTSPWRPRRRMWGAAIRAVLALMIIATVVTPVLVPADTALAEPVVGVSEPFWVTDLSTGLPSQIQATARCVGEHVAVYVADAEDGWGLSEYLITQLALAFDTTIYPVLTQAYGSGPSPGIDGDPRVVILIYDFNDDSNSISGFFDARDINPGSSGFSNRREMFYLNLGAILAAPGNVEALAAHEFAHLVTYYRDVMLDPSESRKSDSTWLMEAFATYAEHLAGYDGRTRGHLLSFTNAPDFNLTYWTGVLANYGASYSFIRYLADREGEDAIRALVNEPLDGVAGINAALASAGCFYSFPTLFDDWIVASFLDKKPPPLTYYWFPTLDVSPQATNLTGVDPIVGTTSVSNYGAVYLDFPVTSAEAEFQAVIDGSAGAPLQAALISWDSTGALSPSIEPFDFANAAVGDTVTGPTGYDRHTLAVWARGQEGLPDSYQFQYSGAPDPPGGVQFLDMGGSDQFYPDVAVLLERGVISGKEIPEDSGLWFFAGAENLTRAQFAKIIVETIGHHTEEVDHLGDPSFSDVRPVYEDGYCQAYPYDYIEEAVAEGIVTGYGDGTFGPYNPIKRGQLVLMIIRGAKAAGEPLLQYNGSAKVFADVPVSHPLYEEIMTAYKAGILNGSPGKDGRLYFYPDKSASRNHVAKMTANLIECLEAAGLDEQGEAASAAQMPAEPAP